jgi:hypothetical protein
MAVRKDEVQLSISFITDESKRYAKLIQDNKQFISDLTSAQKKGEDVAATLKKIVDSGKGVADIDLTKLTPSQLVERARQLDQIMRRIPQSTPEYKELEASLKQINSQLVTARAATRGVAAGFEAIPAAGGRISRVVEAIAGTFGGLSLQNVVSQLASFGAQLFKLGPSLDSLQRKAQTVFGETLPQVTAEAKENAAAAGLTVKQYTNASAAIADLLIPMKFTRQESASLSTQLLNLSGALSEWTGGQFTAIETSQSISKAILGEREELERLGISIREEDVQNRLREKGLSKLTGTYRQQAAAIATIELITEKSIDAQNAYAQGSDTLLRRQTELLARIKTIGEDLAVVLLPVVERLVSFAGDFVDILEDVSSGIESLIDPAKKANDQFSEQSEKVAQLQATLPGLLDRYDELKSKSTLTEIEQKELANVIKQIGEITPIAVTEIDNYGNALNINAEASRAFLEQEQKRLKFLNEDAINETRKQALRIRKERDKLKSEIESGTVEQTVRTGLGTQQQQIRLNGEDIAKRQKEVAQLTEALQGARNQIKFLQGEPLTEATQAPKPTKKTTDEVTENLKNAGVVDPKEVAKRVKEAFEARLKEIQLAAGREEIVVEKKLLDREISESAAGKRMLEIKQQQYQAELAIYKQFGQLQTKDAIELQKDLQEVAATLNPERISVDRIDTRQPGAQPKSDTKDIEQRIQEQSLLEEGLLRQKFANQVINEIQFEELLAQIRVNQAERKLQALRNAGFEETTVYKKTLEEKIKLEDEHQKKKREGDEKTTALTKLLESDRLDVARDALSAGIDLLSQDEAARKKHSAAIKAFEIGQVLIDSTKEISGIWRNANSNPINQLIPGWGPIFASIQTGFALARSAAAVRKITATKYARGGKKGFFGGRSHSQGGTMGYFDDGTVVEVEKDEYFTVLNRRSSEALRGLSAFNQMGGGVPFFRSGGLLKFENGGAFTTANTTPTINLSSGTTNTNSTIDIEPMMAEMRALRMAFISFPRELKAKVVYGEYESVADDISTIRNEASI